MADLKLTITSLHSKVEKLVFLHRKQQEDLIMLDHEKEALFKTIQEQKNVINKLEEKYKVLKLAKTFTKEGESTEVKSKVNELVREIDKCIALLNK